MACLKRSTQGRTPYACTLAGCFDRYTDDDSLFYVSMGKTMSDKYLMFSSESSETSETWYLDLTDPVRVTYATHAGHMLPCWWAVGVVDCTN